MPDDIDPNAPPPAAPAPQPSPTPAAPPAPAFTQAQVDAMVADAALKAHNAAEAAARRRYEGREPAPARPGQTPASTPSAPTTAGSLTLADLGRYDAFRAAAAEHGIPARGAEMLLEQVMTVRPPDTRAWVAEQAAAFGWTKPTGNITPPPAGSPAIPVAATQPLAPATSTPSGSPPASSAGVYDLKPSQMKPQDVAAYVAKNGHRAFSALVRQELAGTVVTAPPRR